MKGKWIFLQQIWGGSLREADIYVREEKEKGDSEIGFGGFFFFGEIWKKIREQERRRAEQKGRFTGFSASLGSRSSKPEVQHTLLQRRLSGMAIMGFPFMSSFMLLPPLSQMIFTLLVGLLWIGYCCFNLSFLWFH